MSTSKRLGVNDAPDSSQTSKRDLHPFAIQAAAQRRLAELNRKEETR